MAGKKVSGPLHGIKVIDLSRVLAGPWATQLLADYGADVIKIEKPGEGDDTRQWGPPWLCDPAASGAKESAYFLATNRHKRSITTDLSHADGRRLVADLAHDADVLVENFRVGTMKKFGLHAAALQKDNPRLIYCSISAYGQNGSRSSFPGYDAMIQAEGGLMSITGESDENGGAPQKVGVAIADILTGMYATTAILAALESRHRTGTGQHIDLSLYQCQVAWLANQSQNFLMSGTAPTRLGNAHPNIVPYQSFATADGYIMLAVGNDRQFAACCRCLGYDQLGNDPRFSNNEVWIENRAELVGTMSSAFARKTTAVWLEALAAAGVPAGRINDIAAVFDDEFAAETGLVRHLPHSFSQDVPTVSNPVHFSATPIEYGRAAPLLGEHTEEVLMQKLGYTKQTIDALRKRGTV
jgi:crotonobetainyl-CoA:carnitine CoA-transferase CaiB-like acyl-CoA transferase